MQLRQVNENQNSFEIIRCDRVTSRGIARLQNEGAARGARVRGADWDSKWQLTIDLCTKCDFMGGQEGGRVSARGQLPPDPHLATPLVTSC